MTGRSRVAIVAAGLAGLALVGVLLIGSPKGGGPELAAPGNHATVSVTDSAKGPVAMGHGVFMGASLKNDASKPLKELKQYPAHPLQAEDEQGDEDADGSDAPHAADTTVQLAPAAPAMPATSLSFDGIGFPGVACNCAPPDTNGEVGATQYVQIVNEGYQVWNKATGASVYGPVGITTIWSGFGGVCELNGDGDPVVLYDQLANRWLVSQFAGASIPTDECVAVSQSSDATGGWYRYDFHLGSNFFDYPKLAVWPDGYYMSMNVFNSSGTLFLGAQPFVLDRAKMLLGQPATFQTTGSLGGSSDPILPADVDGSTLPPANAPETFVRWPGIGSYQTYHYHADWVTPANSTFTTFASPAAAGFSATCGACVPQPGTSSRLDSLDDRLMFRLAYRNFGDHESVVGNFTVSSGGVTGVRWFELRNVTSGPETVFQESTYQPDSTYRWMGSAAMDHNGDIAVGFSASSSSVAPSLRYAGRLAGDPLGSLAQGEAVLFGGAGSQAGTSSRWGDYSDMTVDPVDDCTFWFTSEYYPSGASSFNWRTRIGSFTFPGCGSSPTTGSISGHVYDSHGGIGLAGASVEISGGASTTTDGSGAYSFSGLNPASYSLTASKAGYTTSAPANVTVTAGSTTPQDFTLVSTTGWVSGHVTDSSSHAAIAGATVTLSSGPSTTTDASGAFTFAGVAPGAGYTVTGSKAGYSPSTSAAFSVGAGATSTVDLTLTPKPVSVTGWVFAGSSAAGATGDRNGYETSRANLLGANNNAVATDANSGTGSGTACTSTNRDSENVGGYAALSSASGGILGIQVQIRGRANSTKNAPKFCVQLSWNGGTSWTAGKITGNLTTSLVTYNLGAANDTWGRTWSASDFSATNFRIRVVDLATTKSRTFYLDSLGANVTYQ